MTDKLLLAVCLTAAGTVVGLLVGRHFKLRKEYFDDLDNLLQRFSATLNYTLDTVPSVLTSYETKSNLLGKHVAHVLGEMSAREKTALPSGFLTKSETEFVSSTLAALGTRNVISEKSAVESSRIKLGALRSAADEKYSKLGKPSIKLGFLFGLLISVLCW